MTAIGLVILPVVAPSSSSGLVLDSVSGFPCLISLLILCSLTFLTYELYAFPFRLRMLASPLSILCRYVSPLYIMLYSSRALLR